MPASKIGRSSQQQDLNRATSSSAYQLSSQPLKFSGRPSPAVRAYFQSSEVAGQGPQVSQVQSKPQSSTVSQQGLPPLAAGVPQMPLPPRLAQPMQREPISDKLREAFGKLLDRPVKHPLHEQFAALGYYEPEKWEYCRGYEPGVHMIRTTALTKNKFEQMQEAEATERWDEWPLPKPYEKRDVNAQRQWMIQGAGYNWAEVEAQWQWRQENDAALTATSKEIQNGRVRAQCKPKDRSDIKAGGLGGASLRGGRKSPYPGVAVSATGSNV